MFPQVLTRVNVFNGRTYSEDPAILAWNVINEPRNPASQIIPGVLSKSSPESCTRARLGCSLSMCMHLAHGSLFT